MRVSAASIKTALLLSTLLGGTAAALALDPRRSANHGRKAIFAPSLALAVAGALAVLVPIASFLFYLGVLDDFVRCVVLHNLRAVSLWSDRLLRAILALLALPLLLLTARRAFDGSPRALARVSLLLSPPGSMPCLLNGFSPIVQLQGLAAFVRARHGIPGRSSTGDGGRPGIPCRARTKAASPVARRWERIRSRST